MKKSYIILLIAVLILVSLSTKSIRIGLRKSTIHVFKPVARILSNVGGGIKNNLRFVTSISDLRQQNKDLSTKLQQFNVDSSKIIELENENELLKKELGFIAANKEYELIPAKIIGREPTSFFDSIIIDKGELDGVKTDAPVISNGALIGQIVEVMKEEARINLITSRNSLILAMLQGSRSKGVLRGGISGLILEDITQDVQFGEHEYVVTSGLDGMRQGILIGTAEKVQSTSSDLFKNISVEPVADLSTLEIVFVIK